MKRKTKIATIIILSLLSMLSGCLSIDNPFPPPNSVRYYDSIEEAVSNNSFKDQFQASNIGVIIKLFQNEKSATLFFKSGERDYDVIFIYKFYVKNESGKTMYSRPLSSTSMDWEMHKGVLIQADLNEIGEVRECIAMYSFGDLLTIDETKRFVWGVSQTERIRSLRIEGQLVAEVIEIELGGENVYFWYYDDLETDKNPIYAGNPDFNVGEMIITMD